MRKIFTLLAVLALTLGMVGVASATDHGHPWPEHGHIKLLHAEWTGEGPSTVITSYKKCIDVAGGNTNDHAHHATLHMGQAGQALAQAGHLIVPTADYPGVPWSNCAEFEAITGGA